LRCLNSTRAGWRRPADGRPLHGTQDSRKRADTGSVERFDRGSIVERRREERAGPPGDPLDYRGRPGGGGSRRAGPGRLRARLRGWPGPSQRLPAGSPEDGGGLHRIFRSAGRRYGGTVPLRAAPPPERRWRTWLSRGWPAGFPFATSRTPSRTRAGGCCCRGRRSARSASGCGRITRNSRRVTCRNMTSRTCSSTASPSASGRASVASPYWRPGAMMRAGPRFCCT